MRNKATGSGPVLVLDDEEALAGLIDSVLSEMGYEVSVALSVAEGLALIRDREFDVALLDLHLKDGAGTDVLRRLQEQGAMTEAIVLTGDRDIASAIEVMKMGASDYLTKPTSVSELEVAIAKAKERHRLRVENQALRVRLGRHETRSSIVTEDPVLLQILASLAQVGPSDLPVLVQGESGTGKESLARAIHDASHHRMEPFVAVNCAALPDGLIEKELFGYERGAFAEALERKPGVFEVADRGTLFLDEIDGVSLAFQPRLLRVIETGEFERVGSTRPIRSRVRLVAGTNEDLSLLVESGRFRRDLHTRLNGATFRLPPLRERPKDILPLSLHFLRLHGTRRGLSPRALEALKAYSWPGNVRELEMVVRRAGVLGQGDMIEPRDFPFGR